MIDRKIKKWGNWYKAERWLKQIALQNQGGLENPSLWWVFMDEKFPTEDQRKDLLLSGWKVEVVSPTWWKKIIQSIYPETSEFSNKADQKHLWLLIRMEEERKGPCPCPKIVEEQQDCWILYENQVWSKERLEKKGLMGPAGTKEAQRMDIYGRLGGLGLNLMSSMEAPYQTLYSILDRKGRGDV
jgi:hypothetical protein